MSAGNEKISFDDLVASLVKTSGDEDDSNGQFRRIFVDSTANAEFVVGMVVTVKDQKSFCELVQDKGNFVVSVTNLVGANKLMEFNFFVINKSNGHGLYQHYFHSCSPGTFGSYLKTRYRRLTDDSKEKEIDKLKASGHHSLKKEKAIRSDHAKGLNFSLLVHNETLEEVLSEFKKIRAFEYEFSAVEPDLVKGAPISNYVKRLSQKVSFDPQVAVGVLAKAIQGSVDMIKPKSGRVSVVQDVDGVEVPMSVRLLDIPENFGEEDYDDVAGKLNNMDTGKFYEHKVVEELLTVCRDKYPHVFMKVVKVVKP
ncbi:hypothetical protein B9Y66_02765 [Stenotrophomonas maltophilia]|nr:hypothetical protein B9Y66_02765 [Stenotrophomonas maltophilia]